MKKMLFVLALLICHTFPVKAETVFDDSQSFLIAKTVKMGEESTGSINQKMTDISGSRSRKTMNCTKDFYKNSSNFCTACPDNATCDDGKTILCNNGYYKSGESCPTCPQNGTCKNNAITCNNGYYKSGNTCPACPKNGTCKNNVITCNFGYVLSGEECITICAATTCENNPGTGKAMDKHTKRKDSEVSAERCYCY